MLPKYLKHSTFSSCFWSNISVTGDGCLEILITFVFSTFIILIQVGRCYGMEMNVEKWYKIMGKNILII
jgi:hypothetical protein